MQETTLGNWVSLAVVSFEHGIVPWAGRKYASWIRAWARPHPNDRGLVKVPELIARAFQQRVPGQRLTKGQAELLGYPGVPGEGELEQVRRELHEALGRCDWDLAHDLDMRYRELQELVAQQRLAVQHPQPVAVR